MGLLINSEEKTQIKKDNCLVFPYPVKKRKNKTNIIGDIPLNQLSAVDFSAMQTSAPVEIKEQLTPERSQTYYEIRDVYLIKKQFPAKTREPGLTGYAFFFGNYDLEVTYCTNTDSARDHAVKLAIKFNEPVKMVKQNASMKWKRAKNLF